MAMDSKQFDMLAAFIDSIKVVINIFVLDPKLWVCNACTDVRVYFGIDIWVYS